MDLVASVPSRRSVQWWVMVYAAAITPIDVSRLGLVNTGGPDLIKWLLRMPVWFLPVVVLVPRWGAVLQAFRRPPSSWLLSWAGLGTVSVFWALAPTQALLMGLAIAGLTVLCTWYVFTEGWHRFATALSVGLTIFLGAGILLDFLDSTLIAGRPFGLANSPTALGRLAAFNIVIAAGIIWSRRSSSFFWAVPIISAVALITSETRTAMAAALVGVLYGGLRRLSPLYRSLVLAGLFVGLLAGVGVASAFGDIASFGERGDPTSVAGRTSIWPVAWQFIVERPILGYGWGASESLYAQAARSGSLTFQAGTSHSIALAALVQGGVVGFTLLATAIGSAYRHRARVDPWVVAPLVTLLFGGLTEAIIHLPSVATMVLAGCLAAIASSPRWSDTVAEPDPRTESLRNDHSHLGVARG